MFSPIHFLYGNVIQIYFLAYLNLLGTKCYRCWCNVIRLYFINRSRQEHVDAVRLTDLCSCRDEHLIFLCCFKRMIQTEFQTIIANQRNTVLLYYCLVEPSLFAVNCRSYIRSLCLAIFFKSLNFGQQER